MTDKPPPVDPTRRNFIRQLAGDVVTSMGSMLGAAQALQAQSAEAARGLLGPETMTGIGIGAGTAPPAIPREMSAVNAGYRAPFRWDADVIHVVDQRRLPDILADLQVRGAADAVTAISDGALVGSHVQAQVAAATLALLASKSATSRPFARRATIRGAANAFRLSRQGSAPMALALARILALLDELGTEAEADAVTLALKLEAEAIIEEATDDHGMVVTHGVGALPGTSDEPLHLMVVGSTGAMGGGVFGGALSVAMTAHHQGRPIHVLVPEGRPGLEGGRVAAWELRQAGVAHAIVTDAAAPACIAGGEVEAVLAGADRITADGDLVTGIGAYPLALAAAAAGVPFLVFTPTTAIDLSVPEGRDAPLEEGRPAAVLRYAGLRVALEGALARNPTQDLVPSSLVTAYVTEGGVLNPPFPAGLEAAVADAERRRSEARGFAALLAKRDAEVRAAASVPDAPAPDAPAPDAPAPVAVAPPVAVVQGVSAPDAPASDSADPGPAAPGADPVDTAGAADTGDGPESDPGAGTSPGPGSGPAA